MPSNAAASVSSEFIPLHAPEIGGNAWAYVKQCLDTGWVSSVGSFVTRFEQEIARLSGAPHAVAVMNGTAGLHAALKAVGVEPGDEVIVSTLTFVAPVNAIIYAGANPVFMDADPHAWQMDVAKLSSFLSTQCEVRDGRCVNKTSGRRVRAVVPVHILGFSCEIDAVVALAKRFHLSVVEDAAEAVGVRYKGRHLGTYGDAGVFSFNGNKILTTGGGGAVVTNEKKTADYLRYLTTQAKDDELEYVHNEVGFNYRLTNMQAALGVAQLEQLPDFLSRKKTIAETYARAFSRVPGLTQIKPVAGVEPSYWLNTVLLPESVSLEKRRDVVRALNEAKIGARPLWHTIHDLPPYRGFQAYAIEKAPRLYERSVSLPSSAALSAADVARVIDTLTAILSR